jgi:hypothetical protein
MCLRNLAGFGFVSRRRLIFTNVRSELSGFFDWRAVGNIAAHALRIITGVTINVYHRVSAKQCVVHWLVVVKMKRTEA